MKSGIPWFFNVKRNVSIGKKTKNGENIFFKAFANRFQLTSKLLIRAKEQQICLW